MIPSKPSSCHSVAPRVTPLKVYKYSGDNLLHLLTVSVDIREKQEKAALNLNDKVKKHTKKKRKPKDIIY